MEDVPNMRAIVGWCLVTWLVAAAGVAVSILVGDWLAAVYAANAAICAAGWWHASSRWAEWRLQAFAAWEAVDGD